MSIRVSVVVPTYRRNQLLIKCLNALLGQDFPQDEFEIIIVDDAAAQDTRALVEGLAAQAKSAITESASRPGPEADSRSRIRYAAVTRIHGPAAARNVGWRMAQGEIIAFTDDDCLPERDWLREGVAAMRDGIAGVSGRVIVPVPHPPTDYEKNVARLEECEFLTANCFYRRSVLEAAGGFDERYTMAWREDSDMQFKLLSMSCQLSCAPSARVVHPVREATWGISINEQRKSMFDALLYKKYPHLFRRLLHAAPPWRYYAIIVSSMGFLSALVSNNIPAVLITGLAWLLLVLHFSYQRLRNTKHTPVHVMEMIFTSIVIPYLSIFWRLYGAVCFRVWFL